MKDYIQNSQLNAVNLIAQNCNVVVVTKANHTLYPKLTHHISRRLSILITISQTMAW